MADVSTTRRVKSRTTRSQASNFERIAAPETSLGGEQVIFCKLIRDEILRHLNPWKLSDLHCVLEMRCFKELMSDKDLKEMYFQGMWGFKEWDFVLAGWREMSVEEMKRRIKDALWGCLDLSPDMKEQLMALGTKEEIMREYGALAYVPLDIVDKAVCGAWALRQVCEAGVENVDGMELRKREQCYKYACGAGVDFSVIRSLYQSLSAVGCFSSQDGLANAACGGHLDIIEALIGTLAVDVDAADRYGDTALMRAVWKGHTDILNALAGTHNANVEAVDTMGNTALVIAALQGHIDTVNALAGTYNANVEAADVDGRTALKSAAWNGRHPDTVNAQR